MIYTFSEDSKLLLDSAILILSNTKNIKKVLEMGCGPAEVLTMLSQKFPSLEFTGADINRDALKVAKENIRKTKTKIKIIHSDLFSNIDEKFDLILFNPPYLPHDKEFFDESLHGGPRGNETSIRFLKEATDHLNKNGRIILLTSSVSHPEEILNYAKGLGFAVQKIKDEKLFFEVLTTYLFIKP
ncbi:MAG: release factor glutamine methyltransferase [Candidatus Woesearchaeota archaeon]|nr:release factor glutamine methyltransferase [Candidatus Woesearchaeota archaeon]